jgi:hypothetical protein
MNQKYYHLTLVTLFFTFLYLFRFENIFLGRLSNYFNVLIFIFGIAVILYWRLNNGINQLSRSLKFIHSFWFNVVLWFLIVPFVFFESVENTFVEGMYSDYKYIIYSFLPFIFVTNTAHKYYQKVFYYVSVVAIISGFFAILFIDNTTIDVSDRNSAQISYYLYWVVVCIYPYMFLQDFFSKKGKKGYILLIINLVLSLYFLKRSGIVGTFYYSLTALLFSLEFKTRFFKYVFVFFFFLLSIFIIFPQRIDVIINRFDESAKDLNSYDRLSEVDEFFSVVSDLHFFTGFGANNYLEMIYIGLDDNAVRALHIGFYNLFYKGGIPYFLFTLFLLYKIIQLKKFINKDYEILIGFIIGVYFIISYSFENSWSYMPYHFFKLLPIYRAIYLRDLMVHKSYI